LVDVAVDYATMTFDGMARGYASFGTDTGHQSDASEPCLPDTRFLMVVPYLAVDTGTWALHNDNAIVDYTYRAYHLTVQASKSVVEAYYGRAESRSYYLSCSTGGRQGLREAQQFPEDFDGVVSRVSKRVHSEDGRALSPSLYKISDKKQANGQTGKADYPTRTRV
jgi:feruloyl esterase